MTLNDPLANVLSALLNAEQRGVTTIKTKNYSRLITQVLDIMKKSGYIASYEIEKDIKGNLLIITLAGNINKAGVIKPRFQIKKSEFERFEKRFLPARNFGMIIVSTNKGLMTHEEAKTHGIGGTLVSYCY